MPLIGNGIAERHFVCGADVQLCGLGGDRPATRDRVGQRSRPLDQHLARNDVADESPAQCGLHVNRFAGKQHDGGVARPDAVRQQRRLPAAADPAQLYLWRCEAGGVGGEPNVAGKREFQAAAERVPVHRGDRGLAQGTQDIAVVVAVAELPGRAVFVQTANVAAGAERPSRTGEYGDANVGGVDRGDVLG